MAAELNPEKFLNEVNQIESLIRGLASPDKNESNEASRKTDELLAQIEQKKKPEKKKHDNTGVNRSVINQKAFDELGQNKQQNAPGDPETMDQAGWMAAMEVDAQERSERREQARREATEWKDQGNQEFNQGNYDKAVEHYSKALSIFKDTTVFWTNRAQAYIKLGEYEKALSDCDWATRVFENCVKAYIHRGRAHLGLGQFDEAVQAYEKAKLIEPKKEAVINAYIAEVECARKTAGEEASALAWAEAGGLQADGLQATLVKVNQPDQLPMYYSGGLMVLANINTSDERTLFRSNGGIKIMQEHPTIFKYFSASPRSLSRDELDVCAATFCVMTSACTDNEENQKQLLEQPDFSLNVTKFLETSVKSTAYLKDCAIKLLLLVSQTPSGRGRLVASVDMNKLMPCLFKLMMLQGSVSGSAVSLLNNLALEKKFRKQIRNDLDETLPAFEKLLDGGGVSGEVLATCVCAVGNLCTDNVIRGRLAGRTHTWQAALKTLKCHLSKHTDDVSARVLHAVLGLLSNLTYNTGTCDNTLQLSICRHCYQLLRDSNNTTLQERSLTVLGHILPHSSDAVNHIVQEGAVAKFMQLLQAGCTDHVKSCMKCLTSCTQTNTTARKQVCQYKGGARTLHGLLSHSDVSVVGNTALCLDHCTPEVATGLTGSTIIQDLLVLARDGSRADVQKNCAILIAKLCKADNRHLEKLRELDGLGILHNLMGKVTL